jgi:hypothetical protein
MVDQIDLCRERVDTHNFMSNIGETPCRNCTDIAQSKNADSQDACLSRVIFRVRNCDLLMSLEHRRCTPRHVYPAGGRLTIADQRRKLC